MTSDQHNIWYWIDSLTQTEQDKMTRKLVKPQGLQVNTQSVPHTTEEYYWSPRTQRTEDTDEEPLPTPLKGPHYPGQSRHAIKSPLPLRAAEPITQPFVAAKDIPKKRANNHGFNFMQPKVEPADDDQQWLSTPSVSETAGAPRREGTLDSLDKTATQACSSCRAKHVHCVHRKETSPGSGVSIKSETEAKPKPPRMPGYRVKKDGTLYKYKPHDRSQGPSMTPQAVDYRERKIIQQEYQDRLMDLIDRDIRDQVDGEGGITPLGRLFKAGVRMMERVQIERAGGSSDSYEMVEDVHQERQGYQDQEQVQMLKARAVTAEAELLELKNKLRGLIGEFA